jgi:hypothetical protein
MLSYIAYVLRGLGDQHESHGDSLLLASLRLLQDIPAHDISSRRVRTSVSTSPSSDQADVGTSNLLQNPCSYAISWGTPFSSR